VKVLFVGEGPHELGPSESEPGPRVATGTVAILARKICPALGLDSIGLPWRQIGLLPLETKAFDRDMKRKGYEAKAKRAVLLSARRFACAGTICVVDEDTAPPDCLQTMTDGCKRAIAIIGQKHHAACGLAIKSIEAWTLGARQALAQELGVELEVLSKQYPSKDVEELSERSQKPDYQPKRLLGRIAQLKHRSATTEFRQAVAERTNVAELKAACPKGFAPFAKELLAAFGSHG
jgi:hypothetical protein